MRLAYLNKADKSDPDNALRVLCLVAFRRYVKFTWGVRLKWLPGEPAARLVVEFGALLEDARNTNTRWW